MINWNPWKQFGSATLQYVEIDGTTLYRISAPDQPVVILEDRELSKEGFEVAVNNLLTEYTDEHGEVTYVESGRDCDCVEYSGRKHKVEGTYRAYVDLYDRIADWADGPFHLELVNPAEAGRVFYESRDLALEAYEDGHPHHIVSRFP